MNIDIDDYFHGKIDCNRIQGDQDDKYGFSRKDYFEYIYKLSQKNVEDEILGVIIGTFAIGFNALRKDFPQLFGNDANIPVLLLHGSLRGEKYYINESENGNRHLNIDLGYLNQQEDKVIDAYIGPTNTMLNQYNIGKDNHIYYIGDKVHIQRITPQHYGNYDFDTMNDSNSNNNIKEDNPGNYHEDEYERVNSNGEKAKGVNHPKYMLVFTNKGVYVMISTANMCTQYSVDSSWTQFFPRKNESDDERRISFDDLMIGSDFGDVLQDFLDHQGKQIDANEAKYSGKITTPEEFIQNFVHDKAFKISDLPNQYCFEQANVDLISVVPGKISIPEYVPEDNELYEHKLPCENCAFHNSSLRDSGIKYGKERIKELLNRHEKKLKNIDEDDQSTKIKLGKLVLQPTSIGNNLTVNFMEELWNCYRYTDIEDEEYEQDWNHYLKLIWPDEKYVGHSYGSLFLKPNYLKSLNHCWKNMFTMEPRSYLNDVFDDQFRYSNMTTEDKEVQWSRPVPHIKSYCRLLMDPIESYCDCVPMAWYIMTSACLSEGAQGIKVNEQRCFFKNVINCGQKRNPYHLYRNFELGVMFHSTDKKQIYQKGRNCRHSLASCRLSSKDGSYAIPIPYELNGGEQYYVNNKFVHRPMFDIVDEEDTDTLDWVKNEFPERYFYSSSEEVNVRQYDRYQKEYLAYDNNIKKQKVEHIKTSINTDTPPYLDPSDFLG